MADTVVRLFDHPGDALRAIRRLEGIGVDDDNISLIANNREGWYDNDGVHHERLSRSDRRDVLRDAGRGKKDDDMDGRDDRAEGAGKGAATGGAIGAGAGLLAGLGMLAVPGLGPIVAAGWLASTATGAVAGAAAGGAIGVILGALTREGVDRKDAEIYAESIRRGGAVVVVRNAGERRREIEQALSDYAADPAARADYYRSVGWRGYDEGAPELDVNDIETERTRAANFRPTTRM
jgi:hypothetical protein